MRSLWLKRNPLKADGMRHISDLLSVHQHLHILDLHNTAVMDEGCKHLAIGLKKNTSLRRLYLDANGITDVGLKEIEGYFQHLIQENRLGVHSIFLDMNQYSDEGVCSFMKVIGDYRHLKRLNFGSCGLGPSVAEQAYYSFKYHPNLIMLCLGYYKSTIDMGVMVNRIGDRGAEWIGKLITENNTLKTIDLAYNDITDIGMTFLANAVEKNEGLFYLHYAEHMHPVNKEINRKILGKLNKNANKVNQTLSTLHERYIKHSKDIRLIDSIYRNKM
jgi:Ran GTPase-activating protein (RanGAP) involved in mRNA processing and transport